MDASRETAEDVSGIVGQEVGETGPRAEDRGLHAVEVLHVIVPLDEVDTDAQVQGQPWIRLPGILEKESEIAVPGCDGLHFGLVAAPAVEGNRALGGIVLVAREHAEVVLRPAAAGLVGVGGDGVVLVARCEEDAGLELVRAAPAFLVVGQVEPEERHRRRSTVAGVVVVSGDEHPLPTNSPPDRV